MWGLAITLGGNYLGLRHCKTSPLSGFEARREAKTHPEFETSLRCCSTHTIDSVKQSLVVVGGGAAGVYGALRAKALCPSLEVIVLEKGQLLSKVRVSGGGRCNVTTGLFSDPLLLAGQYPRGHRELRGSYFRAHGPEDTAAWFSSRGVALKTENDGRVFPQSDSSATIIDCLLNEAKRIGLTLQTGAPVRRVSHNGRKFTVLIDGFDALEADNILLATGNSQQGYKIALQLGHVIVDPRPSLFTFQVEDPLLTEMSGVSFGNVKVELEIPDLKQRDPHLMQSGALLVTHWGFSGPVVLRLSAWAARLLFSSRYRGTMRVDFAPGIGLEEVKATLVKHKQQSAKRFLGSFVPASLPMVRRFWLYLLCRKDMDKDSSWGSVSIKSLHELAGLVKRCSFEVAGKGEFKEEFVTAGGVPLLEVELRTMESKQCPGLFLAGEVLDVDGVTGGFNFQNAWTGGFIAGTAIAERALAKATLASNVPRNNSKSAPENIVRTKNLKVAPKENSRVMHSKSSSESSRYREIHSTEARESSSREIDVKSTHEKSILRGIDSTSAPNNSVKKNLSKPASQIKARIRQQFSSAEN